MIHKVQVGQVPPELREGDEEFAIFLKDTPLVVARGFKTKQEAKDWIAGYNKQYKGATVPLELNEA